jgi:hypothetical protein
MNNTTIQWYNKLQKEDRVLLDRIISDFLSKDYFIRECTEQIRIKNRMIRKLYQKLGIPCNKKIEKEIEIESDSDKEEGYDERLEKLAEI